jgi:hypothetical protein
MRPLNDKASDVALAPGRQHLAATTDALPKSPCERAIRRGDDMYIICCHGHATPMASLVHATVRVGALLACGLSHGRDCRWTWVCVGSKLDFGFNCAQSTIVFVSPNLCCTRCICVASDSRCVLWGQNLQGGARTIAPLNTWAGRSSAGACHNAGETLRAVDNCAGST